MSEDVIDLYDAGCGPFLTHCVRWECKRDGAGPLAPDENGFRCCPKCRSSYGIKTLAAEAEAC